MPFDERSKAGTLGKLEDAALRHEVLRHHEVAAKFWRELLARANAD